MWLAIQLVFRLVMLIFSSSLQTSKTENLISTATARLQTPRTWPLLDASVNILQQLTAQRKTTPEGRCFVSTMDVAKTTFTRDAIVTSRIQDSHANSNHLPHK